MTERRLTYHAPLEQYYIDGSTSRDIVLLLPILQSPASDDQPARCLHLIHLPCGTVGLCNTLTEHACPCCGTSMCYEHESERAVTLPDATGRWQAQNRAFLCSTCATLPMQIIFALYDFRLSMNAQVHP
jgi:hypothetical protein